MRLRARLWLLIAGLLLAVLSGGFVWLSSDLRRQVEKDLDSSLEASVSAFRAGEHQRFKTLEVMAGMLESSPSFRNVLRRTDPVTLCDYLQASAQGLEVDLILVTEDSGEIRGDSRLSEPEPSPHPNWENLKEWGGQTPSQRDYWVLDDTLYQAATVAVVDSQGYIDGFISVAYRLDRPFLEREAQNLGADLQLEAVSEETLEPLSSRPSRLENSLWREVPLGAQQPGPTAQLLVSKSLQPLNTLLQEARWKLGGLALAAFLLALVVSFPFIGQLANPVEALERAQAEMEAISRSSLDGLVSLDEEGRVRSANPAAGLALGWNSDRLPGTSLENLLPEGVLARLLTAPPGTHQQAEFRRGGQTYKVYRTFLRQRDNAQLGSILLFHNVTENRDTEREVRAFLQHLCQNLETEHTPWSIGVGLRTLTQWTRFDLDEAPTEVEQVDLSSTVRDCVESLNQALSPKRKCHLAAPENLLVDGDPAELTVVVEALLDNALKHGEGDISVSLSRVGGTGELLVANSGQPPKDLSEALKGPGLGLKVVKILVERQLGRVRLLDSAALDSEQTEQATPQTIFKISLPLSARVPQ